MNDLVKLLIVSVTILFACTIPTNAGLLALYEDEVIVQRSELIAVGHLKVNSIQFFAHSNRPSEGISGEHHATFVITEIVKGKSDLQEIPIIIHSGLEPCVGGYGRRDIFMTDTNRDKSFTTNLVQIFYMGSTIIPGPVVDDVSKDHIWFLRRGIGYRRSPGANDLGIVNIQDVQPLNLRKYFETYLSDHPEDAVKSFTAEHPDLAGRAQRYLNHLEVQRILKIESPATRFEALLPHYLNHESWAMKSEIRQGIISCGKVAGDKFVSIFQDPNHKGFRQNIILIWRDLNYTNAAPMLIQLLEKHDQFWAEQKLTNGWWNADVGSELTERRRDIYGEVYYSVAALRTFRDPRSKETIELTQKRWTAINFDNTQIVEECDAALKALAEK